MFLYRNKIDKNAAVADIVNSDYRTADVFRKYGIEYCCGGRFPLHMACQLKEVDEETIIKELEKAIREVNISNTLDFANWDIDFLTDFIVHTHHEYLRKALPLLKDYTEHFAAGHQKKFTYLAELSQIVMQLNRTFIPHMEQEEKIIFPYIRQISHAYSSRESYASLLVRTLRKPVEEIMKHEHDTTGKALQRMRELTGSYTPPENACVSHKVTFMKLKEVDADITQHLHLENNILFPKAITMEKELLRHKD